MLPEIERSASLSLLVGFGLMGIGFVLYAIFNQRHLGIAIWLVGLAFFVRGCTQHALGKGRSPYWGLAGILFPFGFLVVRSLADRRIEKCGASGNGAHFLADELEKLLSMPLQPKTALDAWYAAARRLQAAMRQYPSVEIPEKLWHYWSDADIRAKPSEAAYREMQEKSVRSLIGNLRRGSSAS